MKLQAEIKAYGDAKKISSCFAPESSNKKRSNFKITTKKDHVSFDIKAKDPSALRATLNGITKLLTVYEKMEKI